MHRSRTIRTLYFALAWVFFAIGVVGAVLPVVPTTPFMILALWSFARSSQRFHDWLYHHRLFGPALQRWREHRVVPLSVKLVACASMLLSTGYLFWRGDTPWPILAATVALVLVAIVFLASCPSRPPADDGE